MRFVYDSKYCLLIMTVIKYAEFALYLSTKKPMKQSLL